MLEKPIRHLVKREADVFETDFLTSYVEWHVREPAMHAADDASQYGPIADTGIEDPHRRRSGVNIGEFERHAARHHPLFAAGMHKKQIFLAVIEEPEIALRVGRSLIELQRSGRAGRDGA